MRIGSRKAPHPLFLRYNLLAMKAVLQKWCTAAHPLSAGTPCRSPLPLALQSGERLAADGRVGRVQRFQPQRAPFAPRRKRLHTAPLSSIKMPISPSESSSRPSTQAICPSRMAGSMLSPWMRTPNSASSGTSPGGEIHGFPIGRGVQRHARRGGIAVDGARYPAGRGGRAQVFDAQCAAHPVAHPIRRAQIRFQQRLQPFVLRAAQQGIHRNAENIRQKR